jgi:prepilin-type N-terminal cleavage/methylation domain-containing protein
MAWYTFTMSSLRPLNILRGFSLIEILIVVAIISILAVVGVANFSDSSAGARDAQRQTDLKNLQNAIETYRSQNGRYPAGCNGVAYWSGQLGTNYECSLALGASSTAAGTGQYIYGLAPEYISVLPTDPRLNGIDSGYVYRTNAGGTVYKLKAHRTVETEVLTYQHPLKPCDIRVAHRTTAPNIGALNNATTSLNVIGWCGRVYDSMTTSYALPNACRSNFEDWSISYAVWGGQAPLVIPGGGVNVNIYAADPLASITGGVPAQYNNYRAQMVQNTTSVICK